MRRSRSASRSPSRLPRAGNIGGGGFMLIYRADLNQTIAIDYRETAPAATTKDVFLDANGEADPFKSRYSGLAIGVPGTVAGLELAWRKYGSGKFSFADLIAPVDRARAAGSHRRRRRRRFACRSRRRRSPATLHRRASICGPTAASRKPAITSRSTISPQRSRRSPLHGPAGFYSGPVAQKIVEAVNAAGGRMTIDDLANYRAVERAAGARDLSGLRRSSRCRRPRPAARTSSKSSISSKAFRLRRKGLNSAASLHEHGGSGKARLRRSRGLARRSRFHQDPARRPHLQGLRRAFALAHRARPRPARRRDPARRAPALRERSDDAFLDRR